MLAISSFLRRFEKLKIEIESFVGEKRKEEEKLFEENH